MIYQSPKDAEQQSDVPLSLPHQVGAFAPVAHLDIR